MCALHTIASDTDVTQTSLEIILVNSLFIFISKH